MDSKPKKKSEHYSSEDDDDEVDEVIVRKQNIKQQRSSVSAECFGTFNKKSDFVARSIDKPEEVKKQIEKRLSQAFMFQALDPNEQQIVIGAMEEKNYKAEEWVIKQGEEGDVLYVVETGKLDCFKKYYDKPDLVYLKTYEPGESFGELALLYNAPRAASIQAKTNCRLFALDRETFNHIVKDSSMKKREKYEEFLKTWKLLTSIDDPYEKTKIADAFQFKAFKDGEKIIQKGSKEGNTFIVLEGKVSGQDSSNKEILTFTEKGDYFGEIPVIFKDKVQPLNFVASGEVQGVFIPETSYKSTLKMVETELINNAAKYSNLM